MSPSEIALKYIPDGNSKVGQIDIRPPREAADAGVEVDGDLDTGGNVDAAGDDPDAASMLVYTLWVDGKRVWRYRLASPGPGYRRPVGMLEGVLGWVGRGLGAGRNST